MLALKVIIVLSLIHQNEGTMTSTMKITRGRKIEKTNYAPAFGAKALAKMLQDAGIDVELKKANTNSWYIEAYQYNNPDDIRTAAIRVSDHSKPFNFEFDKVEAGVYRNQYDEFEGIVTCSTSYNEVKAELSSWIKATK